MPTRGLAQLARLDLCACLHQLDCLPAHTPKGVCRGSQRVLGQRVAGKPVYLGK